MTVRLRLDPCGEEDGPLRVVAGSHRHGIVSPEQASELRSQYGETVCLAGIGEAFLLRPLLLHGSSKSRGSSRRRVLHFVFGPRTLPLGPAWHAMA